MRITSKDLKKAEGIIKNIDVKLSSGYMFFPLNLEEKHVDEFGIESKKYKADSYYGNAVIPGLLNKSGECLLAYIHTTSLVSFNVAEYLKVIPQSRLSDEDIDYISQFEAGLVKKSDTAFTSLIRLDGTAIEPEITIFLEESTQKEDDR